MPFIQDYDEVAKSDFSKMVGQDCIIHATAVDTFQMVSGMVQPVVMCCLCNYGGQLGYTVRPWDGRERPVKEFQFETKISVSCSISKTIC